MTSLGVKGTVSIAGTPIEKLKVDYFTVPTEIEILRHSLGYKKIYWVQGFHYMETPKGMHRPLFYQTTGEKKKIVSLVYYGPHPETEDIYEDQLNIYESVVFYVYCKRQWFSRDDYFVALVEDYHLGDLPLDQVNKSFYFQ